MITFHNKIFANVFFNIQLNIFNGKKTKKAKNLFQDHLGHNKISIYYGLKQSHVLSVNKSNRRPRIIVKIEGQILLAINILVK